MPFRETTHQNQGQRANYIFTICSLYVGLLDHTYPETKTKMTNYNGLFWVSLNVETKRKNPGFWDTTTNPGVSKIFQDKGTSVKYNYKRFD